MVTQFSAMFFNEWCTYMQIYKKTGSKENYNDTISTMTTSDTI